MIKKIFVLILSLFAFAGYSQATGGPEMADVLRANGKIYVVMSVIIIIFVCVAVFLVMVDRKLSRIERELGSKKK
jgi:hypothetical protein